MKRRKKPSRTVRFFARWARALEDTDPADIVAMRGKK